MTTPPNDFGQSLMGMPLVQVGFVVTGIGLLWRELHDLPDRVRAVENKSKPGDAKEACADLLGASAKVLVGGLMMALLGLALLGVSAGLVSLETALNIFAVLTVPAILVLAYVAFKGVPDAFAKWLLRS